LLSLLIIGYGGQASAGTCVQPAEARAFSAITLKTELMVGALSCGRDQQYNRYMSLFLPYIQSQQQVVDAYFERRFGLAGQTAEDSYITELANEMSAASLAQGAGYCDENSNLFLQVLALDDGSALADFIAADPPKQPAEAPLCTVASTAPPPPATPLVRPAVDTDAMGADPVVVVHAEALAPPSGLAVSDSARPARMHRARPLVNVRRNAPKDAPFALQVI
jgi:hypothetical protein